MSEQPTCGRGLAEHATLHAKLSNLLWTIGRNLELHLASLDPSDEVSRPEYEAYTDLVRQHRDLAARLRSIADQMASYRNLPMANHDPEVLGSTRVMDAFRALIAEQEQLIALLQGWVEQDRALLGEPGSTADHTS